MKLLGVKQIFHSISAYLLRVKYVCLFDTKQLFIRPCQTVRLKEHVSDSWLHNIPHCFVWLEGCWWLTVFKGVLTCYCTKLPFIWHLDWILIASQSSTRRSWNICSENLSDSWQFTLKLLVEFQSPWLNSQMKRHMICPAIHLVKTKSQGKWSRRK